MLKSIPCLILALSAVTLFPFTGASAEASGSAGRVITVSANGCTCVIGVDFREELGQLFLNWGPDGDIWEDPSQVCPRQMLPLRAELLREFADYSAHQAVKQLTPLLAETPCSPDKVLLCAGEFGRFDPDKDWYGFKRTSAKHFLTDRDKYNENISGWVRDVSAFVLDSDAKRVFEQHQADYAAIMNEVGAMTDDGRIISAIISNLGFCNARFYVLPSAMINPGRNYATDYVSPDGAITGYFTFGPYKQLSQNMFRAHSWSEVPVSFNDREQFFKLCLHEMTHLLLSEPLCEAVGGREAEYEDLLMPLEPTLKDSYGELKGNGYHYLEELVTRAFTLEYMRRFVGGAQFRQLASHEATFTHGFAILLWRYLYRAGLPEDDRAALLKLLAGVPQEMQSWSTADLAPYTSLNEYSLALDGWTKSMLPMFFKDNPQSFQLVFDASLPGQWREQFTALLASRLGYPAGMLTADSEDACPFPLIVRLDTEEQFAQRVAFSGMDMALVRQRAKEAASRPDPLLFTVILEPKPEGRGVRLCWDILAEVPPPAEKLVPYYVIDATHMLVADDMVLALDTWTRETRLIDSWLTPSPVNP